MSDQNITKHYKWWLPSKSNSQPINTFNSFNIYNLQHLNYDIQHLKYDFLQITKKIVSRLILLYQKISFWRFSYYMLRRFWDFKVQNSYSYIREPRCWNGPVFHAEKLAHSFYPIIHVIKFQDLSHLYETWSPTVLRWPTKSTGCKFEHHYSVNFRFFQSLASYIS